MTVSLSRTKIPADGVATTTATATECDDQGQLLAGEPVTFSSTDSGESIGSVTDNGNGTYSAQITASTTPSTPPAGITITATDSNPPGISGSAQLTQTGPAATITVGLAPTTIVADGSSTTTATATVKDAAGNLLASESVTFSSSDGGEVVGPATNNGDGTYSTQITASTTVNPSITITAKDGSKSGAATLNQTAGPAASIALQLNPASILADGASTTTATATVTDAEGHPLAGQSVSLSSTDPGQRFGAATYAGNGNYRIQITSSTTVGLSNITAIDGAISSLPATLTQTTGAAARIALVLSPPTILADAQSTTSATATITDAQGHPLLSETGVKFASTDKHQSFGPIANNTDGTYTVQIRSSSTVGSSTITATDGSATPGQATLIQAAGPSTTSLFASTSSLVTNQPVTLVASVNGGSGAPSGAITFENAGAAISGCTGEPVSPSSTVATCQTSFGAAGSPLSLTAVFIPGSGSTAPGSTGSLALNVKPDSTSVAVSGPAPAVTKRRITYIAVVSPPSSRPGPIEPTGTVRFFDNGKRIAACTAQPVVNSTSTCVVVYARAGSHSITADYSGDANFTGSSSRASRVTVTTAKRPIRGQLNPTMQWTFRFRQSYTTVVQLMVNGTSAGDIVTVTCHGPGCPFTKRVSKLKAPSRCARRTRQHRCTAPQQVDIARALRSHHLRAGVTVTVTITRPNWVGKSYTFKMRVGHGPRIGIGCLAPGSVKPGVGCTT